MSLNTYPPGCVWVDWCYPTSPAAERLGFPNGCYVVRQQANHVSDVITSGHASPISAIRELLKFPKESIHPIMREGWRGEMVENYRKLQKGAR